MKKREERRDRTYRYGNRTRRTHLRVVHSNGPVDCLCELSAWKFAKGKVQGCDCRGRQHGSPKVGKGLCGGWGYRDAVKDRIKARRLCHAWLGTGRDGDIDG